MDDFSSLPLAERERILAKLAKLKALAECPTGNVNETATAAAHMTRLMMEYRIEVAELLPHAAPAVVEQEATPEVKGRAFPLWQAHLLGCLAKAHDCVSYETRDTQYYPWGEKAYAVRLCMLGSPEDIAQARNLYLYCVEAIERLAACWRGSKAQKNDFRTGAATAIGTRVLAEREAVRAEEEARARAQGQQSRALMVLDRQAMEVQGAAQKRGVHTVTRRVRPPTRIHYEAGYEAGSKLTLPGGKAALPTS